MNKNSIEFKYNHQLPILKNDWRGNIMINKKFYNDAIPVKSPIKDVIKWKLSSNPQKKEKERDKFQLSITPIKNINKEINQIIWLGHASFLIILNKKAILTDPCFYDIPTAKRLVDLPLKIEQLKQIDYLLISHDHRDHFDVKSVQQIVNINPNLEILTPLNFKQLLLKNNIKTTHLQEAGWYQQYKTDKSLEIIFLPTKHWGRRGIFDYNKVLWGSFLIKSNEKTIFFSGDTAYSLIFKSINKDFGNFDICLLPIGAYSPSFIMSQSHATPQEAYQIFNDLKGKLFIPMHYGTYDLSDEPLGEPLKLLDACFENKTKLKKLNVGESYIIESADNNTGLAQG